MQKWVHFDLLFFSLEALLLILEAKPLSWKELGPWPFWLWHLLQALDGKFSVGAQEGIGTWGTGPHQFLVDIYYINPIPT